MCFFHLTLPVLLLAACDAHHVAMNQPSRPILPPPSMITTRLSVVSVSAMVHKFKDTKLSSVALKSDKVMVTVHTARGDDDRRRTLIAMLATPSLEKAASGRNASVWRLRKRLRLLFFCWYAPCAHSSQYCPDFGSVVDRRARPRAFAFTFAGGGKSRRSCGRRRGRV